MQPKLFQLSNAMTRSPNTLLILVVAALLIVGAIITSKFRRNSKSQTEALPEQISAPIPSEQEALRMEDLIRLAESSLEHMATHLADYTARFEKIEVDLEKNTSELSEMRLKVQTRFRNKQTDSPRRIYIKFNLPDSVSGREVIWREDKYEGKMAVHEIGFLIGLKTLWLDPTGLIAMQGQRHPVSELGIVKLTEQLISRGKKDLKNPSIKIHSRQDYEFDGQEARMITVIRDQPLSEPDDFQKAEIIMDLERNLVLSFRSYVKAETEDNGYQLTESYSYFDLQTNVQLTESDFDITNEEYQIP